MLLDLKIRNWLDSCEFSFFLILSFKNILTATQSRTSYTRKNFSCDVSQNFFDKRIGLLVGFVLSSILMSVVSSAVNTVIVCFAEAPREFQQNHPELSREMVAGWRESWPEECGF